VFTLCFNSVVIRVYPALLCVVYDAWSDWIVVIGYVFSLLLRIRLLVSPAYYWFFIFLLNYTSYCLRSFLERILFLFDLCRVLLLSVCVTVNASITSTALCLASLSYEFCPLSCHLCAYSLCVNWRLLYMYLLDLLIQACCWLASILSHFLFRIKQTGLYVYSKVGAS
jgi:hypothetical protein